MYAPYSNPFPTYPTQYHLPRNNGISYVLAPSPTLNLLHPFFCVNAFPSEPINSPSTPSQPISLAPRPGCESIFAMYMRPSLLASAASLDAPRYHSCRRLHRANPSLPSQRGPGPVATPAAAAPAAAGSLSAQTPVATPDLAAATDAEPTMEVMATSVSSDARPGDKASVSVSGESHRRLQNTYYCNIRESKVFRTQQRVWGTGRHKR